jgi:hypothetical protein
MQSDHFSEEEISVFRTVFDSCDDDRVGKIHINQFPSFLIKLGRSEDEILKITEDASKKADEKEGQLSFYDCFHCLEKYEKSSDVFMEGSDPKVLEFLRILEEYRLKCEEEGNYLEAGRAFKQLGVLRKQEEKRQQKVIQARQISEKQDVQLAHNMQLSEFNRSWDRYMNDYDQMAQSYIQQMTERHAIVLLDFQKKLRQELASKPPRWSKDLLDQRRKQHISARNKNYTQAQKLKKISDQHEAREREDMEQAQAIIFARREAKFRIQQQAELQALLKRIECRRKEHIKQRNIDTKRLLQRNRNVQTVLDTKQKAECAKLFADINKMLFSSAILLGGPPPQDHSKTSTVSTSQHLKTKKTSPLKTRTTKLNKSGKQADNAYYEEKDNYDYPDRDLPVRRSRSDEDGDDRDEDSRNSRRSYHSDDDNRSGDDDQVDESADDRDTDREDRTPKRGRRRGGRHQDSEDDADRDGDNDDGNDDDDDDNGKSANEDPEFLNKSGPDFLGMLADENAYGEDNDD